MAWTLSRDGRVRVIRLDNGEILFEQQLGEPTPLSAWSLTSSDGGVALGYADGTVRLGNIRFATRFVAPKDLACRPTARRQRALHFRRRVCAEQTGDDQWRAVKLAIQLDDRIPAASPAPIVLLDHVTRSKKTFVATVSGDGKLRHLTVSKKKSPPAGRQRTASCHARNLLRSAGIRLTALARSCPAWPISFLWPGTMGSCCDSMRVKPDKIRLAESIDLLD